jgi:hypothetical protein
MGALMKWQTIKHNKHLTDFPELKESVISNSIKNIPEIKKKECDSKQLWFGRF